MLRIGSEVGSERDYTVIVNVLLVDKVRLKV